MFSETRAQAPSTKRSKFPGSRWLKAHLQTTIFVLACIAPAAPAIAGTAFDGEWSVVIATSGGSRQTMS